eukprot:5490557-Pyramimonas_sp.AAC.1
MWMDQGNDQEPGETTVSQAADLKLLKEDGATLGGQVLVRPVLLERNNASVIHRALEETVPALASSKAPSWATGSGGGHIRRKKVGDEVDDEEGEEAEEEG